MSDRLFIEAWSFSYSEFEFLQGYGNTTCAWVGVQLRHFREHAFFPETAEDIPSDALSCVAQQIGVKIPISAVYDFSSDTARRHRLDIIRHLGFRRATERDRRGLQDWLEGKLGGQDISLEGWVSRGYQWCLRHSIYIPSGKIMERLARSDRHAFYECFIENVARHLTKDTVRQLEESLVDPQAQFGFQRLKDDVGAATLENILAASDKVDFLRGLKLPRKCVAIRGCVGLVCLRST